MKVTGYIYLTTISLLISGCKNHTKPVDVPDHEDFDVIHIDPKKTIPLKTESFVETLQFIPLETTRESEFSEITQIECLDDRYIILDKNTGQILFFTKTGKFLYKISPDHDQLPIPYKHVVDFSIDRHNEKLHFNDLHSRNMYTFDLDGNFLRVYPKTEIDYQTRENHHIYAFRVSYFAYRSSPSHEQPSHNMIVFKDSTQIRAYLPFDSTVISREDVYGSRSFFFESDDRLFFTKPYDQNVYCLDDEGHLFRAYQFTFPGHLSLPEDFTTNSKYQNKRKQFVKHDDPKIYLITDFFQTEDNLVFKLVGGGYFDQFLYDRSTKSLLSLKNYISDSTTYFLPVIGQDILGMDNGKVLSALSSKELVDLVNDQIKHGIITAQILPKDIKDIYDRGNDQNPVLMLTAFKKEIAYDQTF